ncbi:hypothetical protein [Methanobrevibacter sp.]
MIAGLDEFVIIITGDCFVYLRNFCHNVYRLELNTIAIGGSI